MSFASPAHLPARYGPLVTVAGLLGVLLLGFFRRSAEFGLYGDDPAFFGGLINRDWSAELDNVWFCLSRWPQGRPLGMGLNLNLVPYVIFHSAGLTGLYVAAFLIVGANCALLYRLVADSHPPVVAMSAAGFYALAPADTVQLSLVYAYNFEIAVLFAILSAQAALRRQGVRFAITAAIGLLMVEPVVMFALLAPLFLGFRRERSWLAWAGRHVALWVGVVLVVLVTRRLIGDPWGNERVSEIAAKPLAVLTAGGTSAVTGIQTHLDLVLERMVQPFREADSRLVLIILGAVALGTPSAWGATRSAPQSRGGTARPDWWPALRLLVAGCAIMLAVYFCYFRPPWHPANWRTGFMSGVHVVAALGSCLVFAGGVALLAAFVPRRLQPAVGLLPVVTFASLAGFGELVQRDYANNWAFQRSFWEAYSRLCPDATEGTFVLVPDRNLPRTRYIDLFSWGSEILPGALYHYRSLPLPAPATRADTGSTAAVAGASPPGMLTRPPAVILTAPELASAIRQEGPGYAWKPNDYFMLPKAPDQQPEAGNVIVLAYDGKGNWQRLDGEVGVDGGRLRLRPIGGDWPLSQVRKSPLAAVYGL